MTANDISYYLALAKQHGPLLVWGTAAAVVTVELLRWLAQHARQGHGQDAHWASRRELRKAYLLAKHGIVLGRIGAQVVRYNGRGHVFVVAATQTGKSTSLVKPTLLEPLPGTSVIVNDPKDELHATTGAYRSTVSRVIHLAPMSSTTDHYNPLHAIRLGEDEEFADLQLLAAMLANPSGEEPKDETARHFMELVEITLAGLILYGLMTGSATHLPGLHRLITQSQEQLHATLQTMASSPYPQMSQAGRLLGMMDEKQFANVYTTLVRAVALYGDPQIATMVATSDFQLRDIRQGPQPLSLYWSVPFRHLARTSGLTRLFFHQWLSHATDVPQDWRQQGWHTVLGMGEEFPSLKKLHIAKDILNHGAGLGVQLCLISPSMNDIEDIWGAKHNFLDNSHVQCFFGITDERIAERVSKRLGTRTVVEERVSTNGGRRSVSRSSRKEPLMSSSDITHMLPSDILVLARNHQIVLQQTPWDAHEPWASRGVNA